MKKSIKLLAIALALFTMVGMFASCGKKSDKLVVGITDFAPMDYKDDDNNWIGFDAELATAFAESLGMEVEFVEINWDKKVMEINAGNIDCVWNGMTLTDEVTSSMDCSDAYLINSQVVVLPEDVSEDYQTAEDCKTLKFAVEAGSAGEEQVKALGAEYTAVDTQAKALMEVKAGTCDACVIDSLMACAMIGEDTSYPDFTYTVALNSEEYGIGFKQGSDLCEKCNEFIKSYTESGDMQKLAEKYDVQGALIND